MRASDLPRAIGSRRAGRLALGASSPTRYGLDEWPEAFAALVERRGLKVVVEPDA